jgi:mono/diheme cytochrome c family protein
MGLGKLGIIASVVIVGGAGAWWAVASQKTASASVDFNRDIRPILNANCMSCHGGVKQAGNVSFSYREQALGKGKSGRPTIVPGGPRQSELMARVTSGNPETRMPLHAAPLNGEQIALLRRWIDEGAPWSDYWAFVKPKPQSLPSVKQADWAHQPIDRFVLARLEKEKLRPSQEANKAALLRRVSLDLTGLPPTPEELAAFRADISADAYEKQVDRLLASPRYGERWASLWLDLARYGDTKGFEKDRARPGAWTYRDWVIRAFNKNLPYDTFVIKQLAGDLLPNPAFEDLIATSFHRQTQANDEGGTDNEEFRLQAVMDRASTTFSVLNGVSFNCVQCHSHPYDPIRHSEYYKFLAFFNTSRDADIAFDKTLNEDWPVLAVPTDGKDYAQADVLQRDIASLTVKVVSQSRKVFEAAVWKPLPIRSASVNEILAVERAVEELKASPATKATDQQIARLQERLAAARKLPPVAGFKFNKGAAEKTGTVPMTSVLEFVADAGTSAIGALRIESFPADPAKAIHSPEKGFIVSRIDAWVSRSSGPEEKIVFKMLAPDSFDNLQGNLTRMMRTVPEVESADVMAQYVRWGGFMANPSLFRARWVVAVPETPIAVPPGSKVRVQLTQTESINAESSPPPRIRLFASADASWQKFAASKDVSAALSELVARQQALRAMKTVPLPVMVEQVSYEKRPTHQFHRGSFLDQVGAALRPDVPEVFPKLPDGKPHDRLTVARWFFSPEQPLTARVAVNRYWEQLFGTGLVETLEDFGSAGEMPSHPALLDWLALHFQNDLRWDMKALVRELVTSATYRQNAAASAALQKKDPRNRLLARGPQQRLTAEMVRDQALQAAGLLNPQMGGPPVMPVQPDGIWNVEANNPERWINATGEDRYRRAIYTYIKRTAIYPSFVMFDAAERQLSTPRRLPTNTPLQALVTLNDPAFQEAAEALAARMEKHKGALDDRIGYGGRWVLSRDLSVSEGATLRKLHDAAGMAAVASALLNLDAALTR